MLSSNINEDRDPISEENQRKVELPDISSFIVMFYAKSVLRFSCEWLNFSRESREDGFHQAQVSLLPTWFFDNGGPTLCTKSIQIWQAGRNGEEKHEEHAEGLFFDAWVCSLQVAERNAWMSADRQLRKKPDL